MRTNKLTTRTGSHELALYAMARGRQVGLDMEYLRESLKLELIINRCSFNKDGEKHSAVP